MGLWDKFWSAAPWNQEFKSPAQVARDVNARAEVTKTERAANPAPKNDDFWEFVTPAEAARRVNARAASGGAPGGAPRYQADQASRPMQRYLSTVGWTGQQAPRSQDYEALGIDTSKTEHIGPHEYSLSPWQMEQAELDYGFKAPDERKKLQGERMAYGAVSQSVYDDMTQQQKNALRFNDMLKDAVQKDRMSSKEGADMESYRADVAEMFGTQGGSMTYAPNTMALLKGLGMGQLRNQDLDEYLSLDRAYDIDEIMNLPSWEGEAPAYINRGFGDANSRLTGGMLDMYQVDLAGKLMESVLADPGLYAWDDASRTAQFLGQSIPIEDVPFGWAFAPEGQEIRRGTEEDTNKEIFFQQAYNALSSTDTQSLDDFWINTEQQGFTDEDYAEIFDYFYQRSLADDRRGAPEPGFRTGQEVRDFIGIG